MSKTKIEKYEEYKAYLRLQNLSDEEYQRRIRKWCEKHKF